MPPTTAPETVLDVLDRAAESWPDAPAMRFKRDGAWTPISWSAYRDQVRLAAKGLIALGVTPGQGVALMSFNRPEWFIADLAAMAAGAVPAGIYTTSSSEHCRYIAEHCGAAVAVLENPERLERFSPAAARAERREALVLLEGSRPGDGARSWQELLALGESQGDDELERRRRALRAEQTATLIYTSGTTGVPKAVMLSHGNILWTAEQIASEAGVRAGQELLSYLPLSHIAEQMVSLHPPMRVGACTAFARSLETLPEDLREVRPHLFFGVPRVWEKIQSAIQVAGAARPAPVRRLAAWARGVLLRAGYAEQRGERPPLMLPLARRLVEEPVRRKLGLDRCRMAATSAAPIALGTLEFFQSLGIPICEVYGMSECTGPATSSRPDRYRTGRAGFALPGAELEIADDGEILIRGPHVCQGYYRDPQATAATIDADGWLHSGDIGRIDEEGFLTVTDRKKELIITSGGKNVAPQPIEARLREIAAIAQAVVIGERRSYLTALLTLDPARLEGEVARAGSPARTAEEAASCSVFRAYVESQVAAVNATLARYETIKRFALIPRELSVEAGELTPTMKLKRRVIDERHAAAIEALYTPAGQTSSSM